MKSICTIVLLALPLLVFSQVEIESYDAYPDIPHLEYVIDQLNFDELETALLWDISIRLADLVDYSDRIAQSDAITYNHSTSLKDLHTDSRKFIWGIFYNVC